MIISAIMILSGIFMAVAGIVCLQNQSKKNGKILLLCALASLVVGFIINASVSSYSSGGSYSGGSSKKYSSASDYIKDADPELYSYMQGRYDAITGN